MLFIKIVHIAFMIGLVLVPVFTIYYSFCAHVLQNSEIETRQPETGGGLK